MHSTLAPLRYFTPAGKKANQIRAVMWQVRTIDKCKHILAT